MRNIILLSLILICPFAGAQVTRKQDNKNNNAQQSGELSVRSRMVSDNNISIPDNPAWSKVLYKELDLTKEANASLYFPEEPVDGQTNLFRLIIGLMSDNKVTAYEYLDGREVYSEKYELNVKDMLDKFHIIYQERRGSNGKGALRYEIDESDVPCGEVLSYYIKERWVFDSQRSMYYPTVEAICPILHRTGDFGGEVTKYPMFWMKYSDINPYLSQHLIMSDGMNNTLRYTFEDYFVMAKYDGDIFKTMNLRNKSLMQLHSDSTSLGAARQKIQDEMESFERALWVPTPDQVAKAHEASLKAKSDDVTTPAVQFDNSSIEEKIVKPEQTDDKKINRRSNPRAPKTREEREAEKAAKASEKSSAAPVRSVRRTR